MMVVLVVGCLVATVTHSTLSCWQDPDLLRYAKLARQQQQIWDQARGTRLESFTSVAYDARADERSSMQQAFTALLPGLSLCLHDNMIPEKKLRTLWMECFLPGGIPGKKCGTIIVRAEELSNCRESVMLQFCGNKLDKKDFFGKSDPFLVFYRSNEDGSFTICHKTEVVKNTLDPVWQAFKIPVKALCNGDYDREMSRGQSQFHTYEVVNQKKKGKKKKKYLNSGTVTLLSCLVDMELTFLDYIKGGTQINFTVAIDFTASNGNPSQPTSLHYMSPYQLNAYAMALRAVGEIIQDYDSDKMFPALGFGAKLPPDGRVSHEFALVRRQETPPSILTSTYPSSFLPATLSSVPVLDQWRLNGNPQNPYCSGIEGVMEAYYQSLKSVRLYGPTHFSPVINHVARRELDSVPRCLSIAEENWTRCLAGLSIAEEELDSVPRCLSIGRRELDSVPRCLSIAEENWTWCLAAATLPMSIIIVGVGPAEFNEMIELDGDEERISSQGRFAERDIVQFVPFRDYVDRRGNHILSMARLAKEVLAEIPDQFLSYMRTRGIKPGPFPPAYTPTPAAHPLLTRRSRFHAHVALLWTLGFHRPWRWSALSAERTDRYRPSRRPSPERSEVRGQRTQFTGLTQEVETGGSDDEDDDGEDDHAEEPHPIALYSSYCSSVLISTMDSTQHHGRHPAPWRSPGTMDSTQHHGRHPAPWTAPSTMDGTQHHGRHLAHQFSFLHDD
ncbi:unnamed protein product [Coregonus sp. 'balchen']|nr:unnamed protein product [Coregonus sp. 'balchen']